MYKHEAEVRAYLDTLETTKPENKGDVRRVLLERKLDNLIVSRSQLIKTSRRAIALMRRVDYSRISPALIYVSPEDKPLWNWYRHILSSAPWSGRTGRQNYYLVIDRNSGGVVGIVDLGSEVYTLTPRDKYIGWTQERKKIGLRHVLNVGTCVCVHPFGILTGGKFQLVAATSTEISGMWEKRYGDIAAGINTTSLYGKSSVYNRIKEFEYLGETAGYGAFHITNDGCALLREFIRVNGQIEIGIRGGLGGHKPGKQDLLVKAVQMLKIDFERFNTHQPRGVYFALLGDNALEFLRGETKQFEPYKRTQEEIADWWLSRWYSMRYPKVYEEIASFDYRSYEVDSQIDMILSQKRGLGETDSARQTNAETGGASPTSPLLDSDTNIN